MFKGLGFKGLGFKGLGFKGLGFRVLGFRVLPNHKFRASSLKGSPGPKL